MKNKILTVTILTAVLISVTMFTWFTSRHKEPSPAPVPAATSSQSSVPESKPFPEPTTRPFTHHINIKSELDFMDKTNSKALSDIVLFYAGLEHEKTITGLLSFLDSLNITEDEYANVQEILTQAVKEYERLTATTMSRDELVHYAELGIFGFTGQDITEDEYAISHRGTYRHLPYVTINNVEYLLCVDDPKTFDEWVEYYYFRSNPSTVLSMVYDSDTNAVVALVRDSRKQSMQITLFFNDDGILCDSERIVR